MTVWGQCELAKLVASDGMAGDYFGYSVSINGETAVVGAPFHAAAGEPLGAAYVFQRNNGGSWNQIVELFIDDPCRTSVCRENHLRLTPRSASR